MLFLLEYNTNMEIAKRLIAEIVRVADSSLNIVLRFSDLTSKDKNYAIY